MSLHAALQGTEENTYLRSPIAGRVTYPELTETCSKCTLVDGPTKARITHWGRFPFTDYTDQRITLGRSGTGKGTGIFRGEDYRGIPQITLGENIMAITASGQGEAKDFQPISAALHHAVCYAAIDLGTQPSADPKYPDRRKVIYMFEVPEETIKIDGEDMPRVISATYTVSLNEKGKLRPMLESWRGRPFTQDELNAFDVSNVVGANCYLNITHTTKNGKTYANIASVNPLPKGVTKVQSKLEHVKWSFEDQGSKIVLPAAPDWILKKIMASTEYINAQQKGAHVSDGAAYIPGDDHDDDDIGEPPF